MNEKLNIIQGNGCCKTVSTVINEDTAPEIATIDMGSGKITYSSCDKQCEDKLKEDKEKPKKK